VLRRGPMSGERGAGPATRAAGRSAPGHGSWRLRRPAGVGLAIIALVGACSPATATPSASTSGGPTNSGQTGAQPCAWPREVDAISDNILIVDSGAAYWLDTFEVAPGLQIVLSGTFPDARYASLAVYTQPASSPFTVNGVDSSLTDYQIAPDKGSVNPWQQQAAPGGHYTVTLREDVAPGQPNTIPIAPAGITSGQGIIVYRVYLPAGGDISKVVPPTVTLEPSGGQPEVLAPCTGSSSPGAIAQSSSSAATAAPTATPAPSPTAQPAQLQFFKSSIQSLGPNADTPYVLAYLTPPGPGDVVVIRGRAPTHASGDQPSPWPADGEDVRYWSLCSALLTGVIPTVMNLTPSGGIDPGCRADDQVKLDAASDYAFVLGTEAQRATIEGVADATFLPFSAAQPTTTHFLAFRYMLVDPGFANSPGNVVQDNDPAATAAVMGPYYPQATVCRLSALVASGVSGCTR
jgi:hypothetical protein